MMRSRLLRVGESNGLRAIHLVDKRTNDKRHEDNERDMSSAKEKQMSEVHAKKNNSCEGIFQ